MLSTFFFFTLSHLTIKTNFSVSEYFILIFWLRKLNFNKIKMFPKVAHQVSRSIGELKTSTMTELGLNSQVILFLLYSLLFSKCTVTFMPLKAKFMTLKAKYKFGIYIFNVLLGHLISLHACT